MSVSKKNEKYYCRFQINGERHHFLCNGAKSMKEAKLIEDGFRYKIQQQQNGVIPKELEKVTLSKLTKIFLEYSETNKKSYATDKCRAKVIKKYFGESTLIKDITPKMIEDFKKFLLEEGRSKATVNRYLEQLSTTFNIAVNNNYLLKNPCKLVRKFRLQNHSVRYLTEDEEKRLMAVLPNYLKDIVIVALNTGLRKTNVLELRWEQINFDFNFIEVLENKGNKHIMLPINQNLMDLFNKTPESERVGYLFVNPNTGKPYTDIKKAWHTVLKEAKIENFRFHDLRHTVGTRLAKANVPVNVIKEILAHSDVKTTMRYVHSTKGAKIDALSKLNLYN